MSIPESILVGAPWVGVALVQATLFALLGVLAWLAIRRRGPALRAAVLLAVLVGLLAVPGLATVEPTWLPLPECVCPTTAEGAPAAPSDPVPAVAQFPQADTGVTVRLTPPAADVLLADPEDPTQKAGDGAKPTTAEVEFVNLAVSLEVATPPALPAEQPRPASSLPRFLVVVWLVGVAACLVRSLWRLALLYLIARRARPIREQEWIDCLASLAGRCGRKRPAVALRESSTISSPLTMGLFRPVILLPQDRRDWSDEERELILGHELAHVRRRDFLAGLVAELVLCLCWFHPLVRWLAGRLRLEQEYAADAWVASALNDAHIYVCCLARLALGKGRGRGSPAPALWRRRPEILRRIDMLRHNSQAPVPLHVGKRAAWAVAVLAAAACVAVAGVGPLSPAAGPKAAETTSEAGDRATADSHGDPLPAGALARLGTARLRHAADVTFVGFGPPLTPTPLPPGGERGRGEGGKSLLTAGQDGTIRLWDLTSRKEIRRFALPTPIPVKPPKGKKPTPQQVTLTQLMAGGGGTGGFRVALTADGKTLAVARGNVIQLWEVETGKELRRLKGPAGGLAGLLFSPDGRTLAGRAFNRDITLWATGSGKELHHIKAPQRPQQRDVVLAFGGGGGPGATASTMAFTPDGKALAAAATDYEQQKIHRSIKFWDVASGKEMRKIQPPNGAGVAAVALAPDGKLLAYSSGFVVRLCEADTGKEVRQLKTGGSVVGLVFVGGRTLAVRGSNARLRLWDTQTGNELRQLSEGEMPRQTGGGLVLARGDFVLPEVQPLALSADGKRIAAAAGRTVRLWETVTGKEVSLLDGHRRAPTAIRVSRDGKTVVSWGSDRVVRRWEAATGKPLGAFPAPPRTTVAAFSADGRVIALANADHTIRLLDTSTGKELHRLTGHKGNIAALGFAPGGKVLASRSGGVIRLWDAARGVELRQLIVKRKERPNQGFVIILGGPGRASSGTGPGLAFSPDGRLLVTPLKAGSDPDKTLVILDVATGKELRKIESPRPIASFALSPDGRTLAAENTDRTITLWEVASGKEQGRMGQAIAQGQRRNGGRMNFVVDGIGVGGDASEPGGPVGVSFSPDGRALAVRGIDGSVHVWDVNAGKEISPFKGQAGRVETISFAPGGKTLASGASDTTVLLWDAAGLLKELSKPRRMRLATAELEVLWGKLAGTDATAARGSVLGLAAAPRQALPFLGQRLKPAVRIDPTKISGWIADLDSAKFATRRAASANLLKVGEQALPALRKALASGPQLETRKRLEELVDRLTGGTLTTEQLQIVRSVEALERMGTPEAAQLLRTLAGGAPGALVTREAQAALGRR